MGRAARWFKGLFGMKKAKERDSRVSGGDSGNGGQFSRNIFPADSVWLRPPYLSETETEQNKHAIAVAAATAAAADAAVAAAQAAVAVVRLTSNGRAGFNGGTRKEIWAAAKIQTVFRGYLARKALRALKGLVKLQALVRGYLVRKRAAATLHSMQALIRAQTAARSQRIGRSLNRDFGMFQPRHSLERFEELRSEMHSKRISSSVTVEQSTINNNSYEENSPKIVEIDTYKTRSSSRSSRRMNIAMSECGGDDLLLYGKDLEWCFPVEKYCKFSTAQSTPRFSFPATAAAAGNFCAPPSPAKSVCGDACFRSSLTSPSYMANTQSFKAKVRSQSAPRQRSERKRLSLDEIMAARNSISGVRMQQQQQQQQRSSCSYYRGFGDATRFGFFN